MPAPTIVEVTRFVAKATKGAQTMDVVTVEREADRPESFTMPSWLAEDLFGVKLRAGEMAEFVVTKWSKVKS